MTTTGDIIRAAMRRIQVLASGEPLPADEGDDALAVLTRMVDAWTNETLLIPVVGVVTQNLITGTGNYTIGIYPDSVPLPSNHIETARPEKIISAYIRNGSGTDYAQKIITSSTYNRISLKTNVAQPTRIYVREGWPLNEILFDTVPDQNYLFHMEVIQPLSGILPTSNLTTLINLPPGYERALINNLCLELYDEYGKQPSNLVAAHAVEGKRWLKRNNYRSLTLGMDAGIVNTRRATGTYQINDGP